MSNLYYVAKILFMLELLLQLIQKGGDIFKIKYQFFCDAATFDSSGKLSTPGIFTNIHFQQFSVIYPLMTFVAGIEGRKQFP